MTPPPRPISPQMAWGAYLVVINETYTTTKSTFESTTFVGTTTTMPIGGGAGKINDDGYFDIVADGVVYYGTAAGDFKDVVRKALVHTDSGLSDYTSVAMADLDVPPDGHMDIVASVWGGENVVFYGPSFDQVLTIGTETDNSRSIVVVDIDGDGDMDIVVGNGPGQPSKIYPHPGTTAFRDWSTVSAPREFGDAGDDTYMVAAGLMDSDDKLDLVVANGPGKHSEIFRNGGAGHFDTDGIAFGEASDDTRAVALGLLNDDAAIDIVLGNSGTENKLYLHPGVDEDLTGFSSVGYQFVGKETDDTRSVVIAELNGDGSKDILVGNAGQTNLMYYNPGGSVPDLEGEFSASATIQSVHYPGSDGIPLSDPPRGRPGPFHKVVPQAVGTETDDTRAIFAYDTDLDGTADHVLVVNANQPSVTYDTAQLPNLDLVGVSDLSTYALAVGDVGESSGLPEVIMGESLLLGDAPKSIAIADFDGSGLKDVVVAMGGVGKNKIILRSASSGADWSTPEAIYELVPGSTTGGFDNSYSVAAADVDADGFTDIIVGNYGEKNLLYINPGSADGFTSVNPIKIGSDSDNTLSVTAAQLGTSSVGALPLLDIVVGNDGQSNKRYINPGSGNQAQFASVTAQSIGAETDATSSIAVIDVDGDADLDIAVGNKKSGTTSTQNYVYLNPGTADFSTVAATPIGDETDDTRSIAAGITEPGDGRVGIVVGNADSKNLMYLVDVTTSSFQGFLSPTVVSAFSEQDTRMVALGDLNGDAVLDVVSANVGARSEISLGVLGKTVPSTHDTTGALVVADLDSDTHLDIVSGHKLFLNKATTTGDFSAQVPTIVGSETGSMSGPVFVVAGDVDNDGDIDLVYAVNAPENNLPIRMYLNPGTGDFSAEQPIYVGESDWLETSGDTMDVYGVALGDLDNDGYLDIVACTQKENRIFFTANTGTDPPSASNKNPWISAVQMTFGNDVSTRSVTLGDMNGDNLLDIVVGNDPSANLIFINPGKINGQTPAFNATLGTAISSLDTDNTRSIVVVDVDGDDDLDVLVGNSESENKVYLNPGSGDFTDVAGAVIGVDKDNTYAIAAADLNGDGYVDVVAGNEDAKTKIYYGLSNSAPVGTPSGTFEGYGLALGANVPLKGARMVAIADLSGDGNLDVVQANALDESPDVVDTSTDVWLSISTPSVFDFTAVLSRRTQLMEIEDQTYNGNSSSGSHTISNVDVSVGKPVLSEATSECRIPGEPFLPVQTKPRIEFPIVTCYTPECIILDPIELLGKTVPNSYGDEIVRCNELVTVIQREVVEPPPSPPPPRPPERNCYYIKWRNEGLGYIEERPVFPIDVIPGGHPMHNLPENSNFSAGQKFPASDELYWYWWNSTLLWQSVELLTSDAQKIQMPSADAFYAYGHPYSWSANTGLERKNTITLFLLADEDDTMFLFYIVDAPWDGSGGEFDMTLTATAPVLVENSDGTTSLPLLLRDDEWNQYTFDGASGVGSFNWLWLECCTDGLVIGPLPKESPVWNITFEGHCDTMTGLDQGTRISQWHPFKNGGEWIHYDVPMEQTCTEYKGIQLSAMPCSTHCPTLSTCGECTSQYHCGWSNDGGCYEDFHLSGAGTAYSSLGLGLDRCCSVCTSISNAHDCMSEAGCGWAPIEKVCISGTPDFPCRDNLKVVQWDPPALCYKAAYNDKRAFASFHLMQEVGLYPVSGYPAMHPKVAGGVASGHGCRRRELSHGNPDAGAVPIANYPGVRGEHHVIHGQAGQVHYQTSAPGGKRVCESPFAACQDNFGPEPSSGPVTAILQYDTWSQTGSSSCGSGETGVPGAKAFYAYNYPAAGSPNSQYESSGSIVAYMVVDDGLDVYLILTIDDPNDGSGGSVGLTILTKGLGASADPFFYADEAAEGPTWDPQLSTTPQHWGYDKGWGTVKFVWDSAGADGMIMGPFPKQPFEVNLNVDHDVSGLNHVKIGTYDVGKNDVGFLSLPIKKATDAWGGVQLAGLDCTEWCQRYSGCGECLNDDRCQYAPRNGGCISKDAYVYDYGCSRPTVAPSTKLMLRDEAVAAREAEIDGFNSTSVLRVGIHSIDMSCPCSSQHRLFVMIYKADNMEQVMPINNIVPRMEKKFTFVDLPGLNASTSYIIYTYTCLAQGTLLRDDCSPPSIDNYIF
jgi:hypothetical protein